VHRQVYTLSSSWTRSLPSSKTEASQCHYSASGCCYGVSIQCSHSSRHIESVLERHFFSLE